MTNESQSTHSDLYKVQFDYAWKWFDFHAKQRTSMFNFYIIVVGATLGAIAALVKANVGDAVQLLCWFGIIVSILFFILDCRNSNLLRYGELNLVYLEKTLLFSSNIERVFYENKLRPLGVLKQEYFRNASTEQNALNYYDKPWKIFSHGFIIPASFFVVVGLFLLLLHRL